MSNGSASAAAAPNFDHLNERRKGGNLDGIVTRLPEGPLPPYVVRLRGLPYAARETDLRLFLSDVKTTVGVYFVLDKTNRVSGDAFVTMDAKEDHDRALAHNKEKMGKRYIEIFSTTAKDMRTTINNGLPPAYAKNETGGLAHMRGRGGGGGDIRDRAYRDRRSPSRSRSRERYRSRSPRSRSPPRYGGGRRSPISPRRSPRRSPPRGGRDGSRSPPRGGGSGGRRGDALQDTTVLKMMGIPFSASESDIIAWFQEGKVSPIRIHRKHHGGEAFVEFADPEKVRLALKRHRAHLGSRYIELYRIRYEEMASIVGLKPGQTAVGAPVAAASPPPMPVSMPQQHPAMMGPASGGGQLGMAQMVGGMPIGAGMGMGVPGAMQGMAQLAGGVMGSLPQMTGGQQQAMMQQQQQQQQQLAAMSAGMGLQASQMAAAAAAAAGQMGVLGLGAQGQAAGGLPGMMMHGGAQNQASANFNPALAAAMAQQTQSASATGQAGGIQLTPAQMMAAQQMYIQAMTQQAQSQQQQQQQAQAQAQAQQQSSSLPSAVGGIGAGSINPALFAQLAAQQESAAASAAARGGGGASQSNTNPLANWSANAGQAAGLNLAALGLGANAGVGGAAGTGGGGGLSQQQLAALLGGQMAGGAGTGPLGLSGGLGTGAGALSGLSGLTGIGSYGQLGGSGSGGAGGVGGVSSSLPSATAALPAAVGPTKMKLSMLSARVTKHDIIDLFRGYDADPATAEVVFDQYNRPTGLGFITFRNSGSAQLALTAKQHAAIHGSYIRLSLE